MSRYLCLLTLLSLVIETTASAQTFVNPTLTPSPSAGTIRHAPPLVVDERGDVAPQEEVAKWQAYASWARRNEQAFVTTVRIASENPEYATQRMRDEDSAFVAVGLARTAHDPASAARMRVSLDSDTQRETVATAQESLANRYGGALEVPENGIPITIFASGTVTESLGEPENSTDDGGRPVGTGALGLSAVTSTGRFTARVSIISTDAVAPADFGPMVLTPGSGSSLTSGLLDYRRNTPLFGGLANHFYVSSSNIRLKAGTTDTATVYRATVLGVGALRAREIVSGPIFTTAASLTMELGLSMRWLHGDVHEAPFFRDLFDGGNIAVGPEAGFQLSFGRLAAAAQIYHFFNSSGNDVPGLTGLQMVAGLSVTGDFLSGVVGRQSNRRPGSRP